MYFGDRPAPRREGGFGDRPQRSFGDKPRSADDNRGNRVDYKPAREGDRSAPRLDYGDRPAARREGGFGDCPQRSFSDDRPNRTFGGEDRPRRSFDDKPRTERPAFGGEDRPRRKFND